MTEWPNFQIPDTWNLYKIKNIAEILKSGGTPSRKEASYWKGNIPFVLIDDITSTRLYLTKTKERITEKGLNNSSTWLVPENSILLSMYATIGATTINKIPVATNQAILAIILKSGYSTEFIAFCLQAHKKYLIERNIQATQKNVNKGIVSNFPLPIPPFPEQKKIAAILSLVQRAIEQQTRLIELTTELKKALMQKLFTEGLRGEPQKMTEIGPVPESWEISLLGDYLKLAQYGLSCKGENTGDYPILRMTNQVNGRIKANNLQYVNLDKYELNKFQLIKGDILFNRTNSFDLVGRTAILDIEGDFVFASYLIRLRTISEKLNPFFLNEYFNSEVTQKRLKSIASRAVSQSNISASRLRSFPILIPFIDEQKEIVNNLSIVQNKIEIFRQKESLLIDLFRTLLHQFMTAQIRVNDLDLSELEPILSEVSA